MVKVITGLVLFLFGVAAIAGFKGETSTANLGLLNIISCSTGISCTKSGAKMVVANTGLYLNTQVATTTASLTTAQCGSTIVSNSADVMTLPEASTALGCRFTFVCGTADDFDVNPADGTDLISTYNYVAAGTGAAVTPSAGDAIRCTDIGSSYTLEAVAADRWVMIGAGTGAITDVN
jgi:hypothetical protein